MRIDGKLSEKIKVNNLVKKANIIPDPPNNEK